MNPVRVEKVDSLKIDLKAMDVNKPYDVTFNGNHITVIKTPKGTIEVLGDLVSQVRE